jgi:hypothetical protein
MNTSNNTTVVAEVKKEVSEEELNFLVQTISDKTAERKFIKDCKDDLIAHNAVSPILVRTALENRIQELGNEYKNNQAEEKKDLTSLQSKNNNSHAKTIAMQAIHGKYKEPNSICVEGIENVMNFGASIGHNLKEFCEKNVGKVGRMVQ